MTPVKNKPVPKHPYMNNHMPDADGNFRFPFITKRPMHQAPAIPGMCRYVDDFVEVYGKKNVVVKKMAPYGATQSRHE